MKVIFTVFYDPKDLGVRYLKSYLTLKGHNVYIIALKDLSDVSEKKYIPDDAFISMTTTVRFGYAGQWNFRPITDRELELLTEEIQAYDPDVIGFGTRSLNLKHLPRIIPALKAGSDKAFLVAGGAGPTLEPDIPLRLGVNAVIRGEGEYALEELLTALQTGEDWHTIKNISYLDETERIVRNAMRTPQQNLDLFPFPSNDLENDILIDNDRRMPLLRTNDYDSISFGSNYRYLILGSRGCIADCSYCGGRYFREEYARDGILVPRVRQRSLKNILDELLAAKKKYNMRMVQFWDEFFIWPTDQLIEFFHDYKKKIDLPFWAYLSPVQLDRSPALLDAVVDAGLGAFMVGLQSGDANFCKSIYNRINDNDIITNVTKKMYDRYIPVQFLLICGNPLQNKTNLQNGMDFFAKMPPFDPSFKKLLWISCFKLYKPSYASRLFRDFPQLSALPSNRDFYYESMLNSLRLVLDDDQFEETIHDFRYRDNPSNLGKLYIDTLRTRHMAYVLPEAERLAGKDVYFWGSGRAYQQKKHLFSQTKPICILNDYTWEAQKNIDGITIVNPSKAKLDTEKPLVIFCRHEFANMIYRKAHNLYHFKDIIIAANIE